MGIMDKMRQKMGIIMIILIAAFVITIVFNWGAGGVDTFMKDRDVVGVVNGEKITIKSFYEVYNASLEQYRANGVTIDARTSEALLQQAWETMVSQILWRQEIERLNISISDEELYHYLEVNPPEFLKNQEAFLTDGAFDYSKYLNILRNPQGNEWIEIERHLRNNVLPYQKLNELIVSSVVVDENEILQRFADQSVVYSVNYLSAPVHLLPDSLFTLYEEDLKDYYNDNKEDLYKRDESRSLRYVYWEKVPSSEDTAAVLFDLNDIALRYKEGESFEELAQIFSEDIENDASGDLGWFAKNELRKEYQQPVFASKPGDVLEPIVIGDEFHLIKVTDKKVEGGVEQAKISLLIRRIDPLNTYDYYATEAEAFTLDYESYGFEKAYENVDAELDTIRGGFTKEFPYFGNAGYLPALAKWAYRSKVGEISSVYENENIILVAQLIDIVEESYKPFADVRSSVERSLLSELKLEKSDELVQNAHASIKNGDVKLRDFAAENAYLDYSSFNSTLDELPYPFGSSPAFADVVRSMSINTVSPPFQTGRYGSVLVELTGRTPLDEEVYAEQKEKLRQALLEEKQQIAYESWIRDLKEKADITDNRAAFGLN